MKTLADYLRNCEHVLKRKIKLEKRFKAKGLRVAGALKVAHHVSNRYHRDRVMQELQRTEQEIHQGIEHLQQYGDIRETGSLAAVLGDYFHENNFANRIVEIEQEVKPEAVIEISDKYGIEKAYAHYGLWIFNMKNPESWRRHKLEQDDMLVIYAPSEQEGEKALDEIANTIGKVIGEKKDAYGKFFHREYRVTCTNGLHGRPATEFVNLVKGQSGRVLVRDDKRQVRGYSMVGMLTFGASKGRKLTVLYRPDNEIQNPQDRIISATAFYHALEKLSMDDTPLFQRASKRGKEYER